MKAEYDSQADALSIDLVEVDHWDAGESIDDTYCHVSLRGRQPVNVELLNPRNHLDLLGVAADRFRLDAGSLRAAAQAALEAPDRAVTLDASGHMAA